MPTSSMSGTLRVLCHCTWLFLVFGIASQSASAAQVYPDRPVEMIVTFAPGGASDTAARSLAPYMSKYLGEAIVVKNAPPPRTGTDIFSRSRPDGYTIATLAGVAVGSDETFYKVRYRARDFVWLGAFVATPSVLFANAKAGVTSFADLAKIGAERPVKIGAFSIYSSSTIGAMTALDAKKIPYTFVTGFRGAAPAMTALIRGDVDIVGTTLASGMPFYLSGDAKPLVIMQETPDPRLPDAPTIGQAGLPEDVKPVGLVHYGLAAPPKTPKAVSDILAGALKRSVDDPDFRAQAKKVGYQLIYVPPDGMEAWLERIFAAFAKAKPLVLEQLNKRP